MVIEVNETVYVPAQDRVFHRWLETLAWVARGSRGLHARFNDTPSVTVHVLYDQDYEDRTISERLVFSGSHSLINGSPIQSISFIPTPNLICFVLCAVIANPGLSSAVYV
jgi:hypothetical protein